MLLDANRYDGEKALPYRKPESIIQNILFGVVIAIMLLSIWLIFDSQESSLSFYLRMLTSIPFAYLLLKLVLSIFYRPVTEDPQEGIKVSVIIPSYNESPESVEKCIQCMLEQDYPVHELIFIDDGSQDSSGFNRVQELAAANQTDTKIVTHKFTENRGKREAQEWGFTHATGDMIMIIDSDGYIFPNAVRELLKPMRDKKVLAVTGHVNARNQGENTLTRYQDILYDRAFRIGRGSQSITNTVLVCSGALSIFRKNFVMENLEKFNNQYFLGQKYQIGDDRRLTSLALENGGKVVYQSSAQCITDVPKGLKQFFKQQVRWSKSFYIESVRVLSFAWKRPIMLLWVLAELLIWFVFGMIMIVNILTSFESITTVLLLYQAAYMLLVTFTGNFYYIKRNFVAFLLSPLYMLVHLALVFPVRIYALMTLSKSSWGTR